MTTFRIGQLSFEIHHTHVVAQLGTYRRTLSPADPILPREAREAVAEQAVYVRVRFEDAYVVKGVACGVGGARKEVAA